MYPTTIPKAFASMTSTGIANTPARIRGRSRCVTGEQGANLENHRRRDDSARTVEGKLPCELVAGRKAGDGAGDPRHQEHNEEAAVADGHGLLDHARDPDAPLQDPTNKIQDHEKKA